MSLASRRRFLASLLPLAGHRALPFAASLAAMSQAVAASDDYKALVCVFLTGGNDSHNTVLARDPASWRAYQAARNTRDRISIALGLPGQANGMLPLWPGTAHAGRDFGLHPQLDPLRQLFDNKRAAIVANVGTLLAPLTKAEYLRQSRVPPRLLSHIDQQIAWQSCLTEGGRQGWGGRLGDLLASANANAGFTCISSAGQTLFLNGNGQNQYQIGATGTVPVHGLDSAILSAPRHPWRAVVSANHSNLLEQEYANLVRQALAAQARLEPALPPAGAGGVATPPGYVSPLNHQTLPNPLALQLQTVARLIAARRTLGMRRQVFFVSLPGFDTHDSQTARHAELLARLAHGIAYFDQLLANLGGSNLRDQVTLFTASDFGRTLSSNGDGTDHGWGGHHFVVGGAVRGREIYGSFPALDAGHERDIGRGALLPQFSVEQYGATLAGWFGLSAGQLADVFPNLSNFSQHNLGFMLAPT
ncbi:DUF1501 domain-containing protein [Massilia sp. YIM B04103]|uniref:DUF1501 domain-containing protein n=1 Tax=Massilia sp. YIM B04103 TaxID=2963106 RepID=UPI00210B7A48|nr:DUF1501 domain-containing protein [Massilia sp. YIM B04103]